MHYLIILTFHPSSFLSPLVCGRFLLLESAVWVRDAPLERRQLCNTFTILSKMEEGSDDEHMKWLLTE